MDEASETLPRRNPSIPDDTVFYAIYPDLPSDTSAEATAASLRSLHLHIISTLAPHLTNYIWQHEPFHLSPPPSLSPCPLCNSPPLPHLHGKTRYGDNLDDEWFIVFLLYHASLAIPAASFRVWDSDGEFLLIEAAFSLPRWINPSNSRNRIFIRRGELHIIPLNLFPSTPTLGDALNVLRSGEVQTLAPDSVQLALNRRISEYPERARANMHRARVLVPLPVAQVLKHEPCLISLAVEGFYDRDVDSMKHAAKMERFLMRGGEIEIARVAVTMSRAMYGQLVQQRFQAPRCYPMPRREDGPSAYAEAELGLKIACGFEMMYQERCRAGEEGKGSTWDAFKMSLESSGCFSGLMPGSKEYKRIMDGALEYYRNSSLFSRTRDMMDAPVRRVDEILSLPYSLDDFKDIELPANDDDSWMYNGEDELNLAILERQKEMESYESECRKRKGKRQCNDSTDDSGSQSNDFNLGDISESMQTFVRKLSSFEGAEVPEYRNTKEVQLDVDQFMKEMESVIGAALHEGPDCDADFEEHTSSSDMDFGDSEEESDIDENGNNEAREEFMQSYSEALDEELNASTLKRSFTHVGQQSKNANEGKPDAGKHVDEELTPVDVDMNLVQSFLDSVSSQQGLPGPASNLLGLMGLEIPPDTTK